MRNTIEMAKNAGFNWPEIHTTTIEQRLERFEALVRADERSGCADHYLGIMRYAIKEAVQAEREACAKVCEDDALSGQYGERSKYRELLVNAIRARGNT